MSATNSHILPVLVIPIGVCLAIAASTAIGVNTHLRDNAAAIVIPHGTRAGVSHPATVDERYAKAFAATLVTLRCNWTSATYLERMRQVVKLMNPSGRAALQDNVDNVIETIGRLSQAKTGLVSACEVHEVSPGRWEAEVTADVRIFYGSFAGGAERIVCRIGMHQVPLSPASPYILVADSCTETVIERSESQPPATPAPSSASLETAPRAP